LFFADLFLPRFLTLFELLAEILLKDQIDKQLIEALFLVLAICQIVDYVYHQLIVLSEIDVQVGLDVFLDLSHILIFQKCSNFL
jgi:hypothetical protein